MTGARSRLKIAVLNRTFAPTAGGAERYSIALVEQLSAVHEFHVFAQTIGHSWPGVTYHPVSMPLRRPRWLNQLWFATATWLATRKGFDIVHSHENTWHGNVQTVHVLPVRHTLFYGRTGLQRTLRWIKVATSPRLLTYLWLERMRYACRAGRAVVVISPSLRDIFCRTYPGAADSTSLVPPGIDLPEFPVSAASHHEAREALELPREGHCVLFVGNDFRKKGLGTLLQAMSALPPSVFLAVVGHSAQLAGFRRQSEEAGMASRVFFLGAMADVRVAYRAASCLAHPTREDTFAMVVLEAMAHGLPVVVSNVAYCGIAGLLEQGLNAEILSDATDAKSLARVIGNLLDDQPRRAAMGLAARAFALDFEWPLIAALQDRVYRSVAEKGGTSPYPVEEAIELR